MKKTHYKFRDNTVQIELVENLFGYRVIIKNKYIKKPTSFRFDNLDDALGFYDLSLIWRQKLSNEYPPINI